MTQKQTNYDNLISQVMERFPVVNGKLKEDEERRTMEYEIRNKDDLLDFILKRHWHWRNQ